jgi:hypothetical protein
VVSFNWPSALKLRNSAAGSLSPILMVILCSLLQAH